MEPCESKNHTEHLFLDLAVAFSVSVRALEAYWTGWPPCMRKALKSLDEASVWISKSGSGLKYFRSGALEMSALISSKAVCSFASQVNTTPLF